MTIEKALLEALHYETKIRDLYLSAAGDAREGAAAEFFRRLGEDERRHADFIDAKLVEFRKTGAVGFEKLGSSLPAAEAFEKALKKTSAALAGGEAASKAAAERGPLGGTIEALQHALAAEESTSSMYRELAGTLSGPAEEIFARFLELEEGHLRIVRAELDLATSTGYWFDFKEFDQEG